MSTVYSQDWSAGNSTFTGTDTYERAIDGPDSIYPEVKYAESVTITGGALDWSGLGGTSYQTAGLMLIDFPTFDGSVGSITATYRPNATSIGVTFFAPLIYVISSTGSGSERVIQLGASAVTGPGAPFTLDFTAFGWGATNYTANDPFTFTADTDYTIKVCWKTGTVTGAFASVAADGYVRVYVNGTLVYDTGALAFYIDYTNVNQVTKVGFGQDTDNDDGAGLFGSLDNIIFSDSACPTTLTGSTVFGTKGTVTSTRTFLANLDDTTRSVNEVGTFYIGGKLIVTGATTLASVTYGGTTDTPQFARLGLGVAPDASAVLTMAGQGGSTAVAAGSSSTAKTLNWNDGNNQLLTLTGNATLTLTNPKDGFGYLIALKQDATGSRTVTWPAAVKWASGTAPTLTTTAGRVDLIRMTYFSGLGASGNYLAESVLNYTPA